MIRKRKQDLVFRYRNDDGSYSRCFCSIIKSSEEDAFIGIGRNITESKESERRQADIIDFLPDATFVIDQHGRVIAWNKAIEEMTGISAEYMLGKNNYEYSLLFTESAVLH